MWHVTQKEVLRGENILAIKQLFFQAPVLQGWGWTVYEITAQEPGPHLCIMAGVHVNEVSSMEAAFQLVERFQNELTKGKVSIMPVANLPALPHRSQHVCPIDNKNINFSFPGSFHGTFSEALADAILNEWALEADCLIDLHGGDLCENVARFTVAPMIGEQEFDHFNLALAAAFEPDILMQLPPETLEKPGRSCSGRARQRRHSAFAEAGANGLIDEHNVAFHRDGVLRVAGMYDMIVAQGVSRKIPILSQNYLWVQAEVDGWCRYLIEPGQRMELGQVLAVISDFSGKTCREILAPSNGYLLWRCTHPVVTATTDLMGIAGTDAVNSYK